MRLAQRGVSRSDEQRRSQRRVAAISPSRRVSQRGRTWSESKVRTDRKAGFAIRY